jgi:hypothetical protein
MTQDENITTKSERLDNSKVLATIFGAYNYSSLFFTAILMI